MSGCLCSGRRWRKTPVETSPLSMYDHPCETRRLPLDCHCNSGANRQFRRGSTAVGAGRSKRQSAAPSHTHNTHTTTARSPLSTCPPHARAPYTSRDSGIGPTIVPPRRPCAPYAKYMPTVQYWVAQTHQHAPAWSTIWRVGPARKTHQRHLRSLPPN